MSIKLSYAVLLLIAVAMIAIGGTLAFNLQTSQPTQVSSPKYQQSLPAQPQPIYQPPIYNPAIIQGDSQGQLDDLKRQQEEQREQKQESLYTLAQIYDDMAKEAEAHMEYAPVEERQKLRKLIDEYRKQAADYRWEAFHQPVLER